MVYPLKYAKSFTQTCCILTVLQLLASDLTFRHIRADTEPLDPSLSQYPPGSCWYIAGRNFATVCFTQIVELVRSVLQIVISIMVCSKWQSAFKIVAEIGWLLRIVNEFIKYRETPCDPHAYHSLNHPGSRRASFHVYDWTEMGQWQVTISTTLYAVYLYLDAPIWAVF